MDPERERVAHPVTTKNDRNVGNFIIEHPKNECQRDADMIVAGNLNRPEYLDIMNRVYDPEGISPTIHSQTGGGMIPKIDVSGVSHD